MKPRFAITMICSALFATAWIVSPAAEADGDAVTEPPLVKVPTVEGLRQGKADRRLKRWHFKVEYTALSNLCAGVPPGGQILQQEPAPGTLAPAFSIVKLHDSCHTRGSERGATVPNVTEGDSVIWAYERLRRHGLRVAIPLPFSIDSLCLPGAGVQSPRSGTKVPRGTTVKLTQLRCALASPGTPVLTSAPVVAPDLTHSSVTAAVDWAEAAGMSWQADGLTRLRPSWQMRLFDNYIVTAQDPSPGSTASPGASLKLNTEERG